MPASPPAAGSPSTVRRADRIVVLDEGAFLEEGTHQELLRLDGRYAELFHFQASRFAPSETFYTELYSLRAAAYG